MRYSYCPICGTKLIQKEAGDDGLVPFCSKCEKYYFDIFPTCVIGLVINEFNEVLLLHQSYLSKEYATFVAGYMQPYENAEEAMIREIKEEVGLDIVSLKYELSHWFSMKNILMLGFIINVKKQDFKLSSEVDSAEWVKLENVPQLIHPASSDNVPLKLYKTLLKNLIQRNEH